MDKHFWAGVLAGAVVVLAVELVLLFVNFRNWTMIP